MQPLCSFLRLGGGVAVAHLAAPDVAAAALPFAGLATARLSALPLHVLR